MRGEDAMQLKVGTFNVLNLVLAGRPFYAERPYDEAELEAKLDWIAGQLRRMNAQIVGFQEVWHETALLNAVLRSGRFNAGTVAAPGADGTGPRNAIATSLPLAGPVEVIADFPPGLDRAAEGLALPVGSFSRPIVKARIVLDGVPGRTVTVLVAHLKSKRPILDPAAPRDDAREEALGRARALIRRAAEAAALRFLVLDLIEATAEPVIVLGDLNDEELAVTNEIVQGTRPGRLFGGPPSVKEKLWDRLLYSAIEIVLERSRKNIDYTNIFNGRYNTLDHILVSEEFYGRNPDRIGELVDLRFLNDHLIDPQLSDERLGRTTSDHGQVVAEIRLP
jgi:hypothetical protein